MRIHDMTRDNNAPQRGAQRPTEDSTGRLEPLQRALTTLQAAGIQVRVAPLYGAQEHSVIIVLPGVVLVDGQLREEQTQ